MGNKRYTMGRTPQTSINNQHKRSKARHELDRTINRYKELNTSTDSRPKQHKHYIKGKLMTAIAIVIMIIATASAAVNDIGTTTYETYNKEQQLREEDTVNRIKASTTKHDTSGVRNTRKTGDKDKETRHREGAETNLCHSPTNGKLQAGEGTLTESTANTQNGNNELSSGTGKNTRNKVTSINHTQEAPNNKHTNQKHLTLKEKHSRKNTKQHHGLRKRPPRGH
jgi:hypothetical protein